jgi:uncharacterized protein (TIGR00251 family)
MRVTVRVRPGARRDRVGGRHGTGEPAVLVVAVAAPPVEGRANDRLVQVLAAELGVPRNAVTIVGGGSGRTKVVEIAGVDRAAVEALLARGA